jgi:hypothetical protein
MNSKKLRVRQHAAREHGHMLGCGVTYFQQAYPEQWERVKDLPLTQAFSEMQSHYRLEERVNVGE